MDDSDQLILISALQHYAYCPRQFALIHIEQVWAENYFTAHGNLLHERVDSCEPEQRGNVRYERGVAVKSQQLRLTGKLDLLEVEGKPASKYFPVEYKRGKPKVEDWDKIQLCAQALCLEEMREVRIDEGALWYWQVRKREPVLFDDALRSVTLTAIAGAHKVLTSGNTPPPTDQKKRCKACSLRDLCEPDTFRRDHSSMHIKGLFTELTGMNENKTAAKTGGGIAKKPRKELESKTGKKVISADNYLPPTDKKITRKVKPQKP